MKKHRQYENDYPSVTEILGCLRKKGLEFWFKNNTPQFIKEKSERGKLAGTQIHEVIQKYIEGEIPSVETAYAEEVSNALNSFVLFRQEMPEIILKKAEIPLTSEVHRFNGTIDCMGEGILVDWKSGEAKDKEKPAIYDEAKTQVAAYVKLWNEVNNANIEKAIIVVLAKDKIAYNIYEMGKQEIDDCFNEVFLSCLKILNYQKNKGWANG